MQLRFHTIVLVSSLLAATTAAQTQRSSDDAPLFARIAEASGVVTLGIDGPARAALVQQHGRGVPFLLQGVPLPGNRSVDLELRPVSAFAPDARAVVVARDGKTSTLAPRVRCFAGHAVGGGQVFLGVTPEEMHGYLELDERLYFLSAGGRGEGTMSAAEALAARGALAAAECGVDASPTPSEDGGGDGVERFVAPVLRTADLFVEADHDYRALFASDQACLDYTVLLFTAASEIYRRDVGVELVIPDQYLRIWNTVPPWGAITGFGDFADVYTWWQSQANPLRSLSRASVHVLTSPVFGGIARGIDGACSTSAGYQISSVNGRFPYPTAHTSNLNWDLFVVGHELGHTFGSPHSELYSPPIACADGSGPDSGSLMSYCHQTHGVAGIGMRFHVREQQRMRSASADAACLRSEVLLPGDYDGNGRVDALDLSAFDGVLAQGFRSVAAEEVFDLDASGGLDDHDHDLLAELVYSAPPARVTFRNGSGANPACLQAIGNPVLGTLWRARVFTGATGNATLVVGTDLPLGGVTTVLGELLVRTGTYGGKRLLASVAFASGSHATHDFALPLDSALFGLSMSLQAVTTDAAGNELFCNALDVVLSPYE